uniref:Uncharacterized protein n=1 Tax=Anguilla anguilla TaxID=7936 RepID=A0A0E9S5J5_ANGAN
MREGGAKGPTQVLPAPCLSISIAVFVGVDISGVSS